MKATEKAVCPGCQGTGKCQHCNGSGHILRNLPTPIAVVSGTVRGDSQTGTRRTCRQCLGSGSCQTCKGTGKATPKRTPQSAG